LRTNVNALSAVPLCRVLYFNPRGDAHRASTGKKGPAYEGIAWIPAETLAELFRAMEGEEHDALFLEVDESVGTQWESIQMVRRLKPDLPILGLSDADPGAAALRLIRAGLDDVLNRNELSSGSYLRIIRFAQERRRYYGDLDTVRRELIRFQGMFDGMAAASAEILFVYDLVSRRVVHASRSVESVLGLAADVAIESGPHVLGALALPEDRERLAREFEEGARALADGQVMTMEARVRHAAGGIRWLRGRAVVFRRAPDGAPLEIIGVANDITDEKLRDEALRASRTEARDLAGELAHERRRLARHLDRSPVGVVEWNHEGAITLWSRGAQRIFGRAAAEMIGRSITAAGLLGPTDWARVQETLAMAPNEAADLVLCTSNPAGAHAGEIHCEWYISIIREGNPGAASILAFVIDATARTNAERAVRASEEELKLIQARMDLAREIAGLGVCDADLETGTMVWNEEMEKQYGLPPGTRNGRTDPFAGQLHPYDKRPVLARMDADLAAGKKRVSYRFRIVRPGGEVRWISTTRRLFYTRDGKPSRMIGVSYDVTDQVKSSEQLSASMEQLRQSNKDLEAFAHIASHDLQAPLRKITGFSDLLLKALGQEATPDVEEALGHIRASASRMAGLITSLLQYARMTSGTLPLEEVDLRRAVTEAELDLQAQLREAQAVLRVDELPSVPGRKFQIEQVFRNLIWNAVKYRGNDPPVIHVHAVLEGDVWRIAVEDNGMGVPPEHRERIFDLFQRLHAPGSTGNGIGLTICKKIIEAHNGRIWVESEPGKGSTFYFTLPAQASSLEPVA
jgi:PAS domain S-box-containing protein